MTDEEYKNIITDPLNNGNKYSGGHKTSITLQDTPWKDYKLPPELKGDIKGIVALNSIGVVEE